MHDQGPIQPLVYPMKTFSLVLSLAGLSALPLVAQVTVVAPPTLAAVEVRRAVPLDEVQARRQLSAAPQVVVIPSAPAGSVTVVPGDPVQTTKTTTVIQTPSQPTRVYNSERNVVVVQDQGGRRELPYVTLPVLFVKETADLLDDQSRTALEQIAGIILAIAKTEPNSVFDIEGHTSTEGTDQYNMDLSAARSKRIYDELTQRYGVPTTSLSAHGYGETFPMYPNGSEDQKQLDRRVLVVRTR